MMLFYGKSAIWNIKNILNNLLKSFFVMELFFALIQTPSSPLFCNIWTDIFFTASKQVKVFFYNFSLEYDFPLENIKVDNCWVNWVHCDDVANAIHHVIQRVAINSTDVSSSTNLDDINTSVTNFDPTNTNSMKYNSTTNKGHIDNCNLDTTLNHQKLHHNEVYNIVSPASITTDYLTLIKLIKTKLFNLYPHLSFPNKYGYSEHFFETPDITFSETEIKKHHFDTQQGGIFPEKLAKEGFLFEYVDIETCIDEVMDKLMLKSLYDYKEQFWF